MKYAHFPVIFFLFFLICISLNTGAQYGILTTTDKTTYEPGDIVEIRVLVTKESNVTVQIEDPMGRIIFLKTFPTVETNLLDSTSSFVAIATIRIPDEIEEGTFRYYASGITDEESNNGMVSGSFHVGTMELTSTDDNIIPYIPVPAVAGLVVVVAFFRRALGN